MIYFITAREVDRVKIGYAEVPQARFHTIQVGSPVDLKLERVCEGGIREEADLHIALNEYRVRGEWFSISPEVEALMESLPRHEWSHRGCQHVARRLAAGASRKRPDAPNQSAAA